MTEFNPMAVTGHNSGEPDALAKDDVFKAIDKLYGEAKVWADGSDIENEKQHDAVTAIKAAIHELGKRADEIRKEEKKPFDEKIDAIQKEFNPYVQPKKGKVDLAKKCLDDILGRWRVKVNAEKERIAKKEAEEAARELREAQEKIRASSGNLLEREEAEADLARAKETQKFAKRAEKDATTRTGLRTIRRIEIEDGQEAVGKALDWAFDQDSERFMRLAITMAEEKFRATNSVAPGFKLVEEKVAR